MDWLKFVQTFWPIAVTVLSVLSFSILLWLKTQFPTRSDLAASEKRITDRIDSHQERLDVGSEKIATLDRRMAIVEKDCESQPSKSELSSAQAVVAGRVSGVESALRGLERQVGTGNDLLQLLIEQGIKGASK